VDAVEGRDHVEALRAQAPLQEVHDSGFVLDD
jgi:hypothetical protein